MNKIWSTEVVEIDLEWFAMQREIVESAFVTYKEMA